jgi:hypothetical protein
VAAFVGFLLRPDSTFVTAAALLADGGLASRILQGSPMSVALRWLGQAGYAIQGRAGT